MQGKLKPKRLIKAVALLVAGLLIGWTSYWAGFSKSMRIDLYMHQRDAIAQAIEYQRLLMMLKSGRIDQARASLAATSMTLHETSNLLRDSDLDASFARTAPEFLFPRAALAFVQTYNVQRANDCAERQPELMYLRLTAQLALGDPALRSRLDHDSIATFNIKAQAHNASCANNTVRPLDVPD